VIAVLSAPGEGTFASGAGALIALVPLGFFGAFAAFVVGMVLLVVRAARQERVRREELWAYALQYGWRPPPMGAPLPAPVEEAARSRRSRLVLATRFQGFDLWLVWHQWTESSSTGDTTTHTTRNLTRYFLWPGRAYPDVRLARRTKIGASLMPVRGAGTGDAEFDRRFLVRGDFAVPPALRRAMLAEHLPTWEIVGGVLVTSYSDTPRIQNLQHRADAIVRIVHMLG
jgi:hypothetical protein